MPVDANRSRPCLGTINQLFSDSQGSLYTIHLLQYNKMQKEWVKKNSAVSNIKVIRRSQLFIHISPTGYRMMTTSFDTSHKQRTKYSMTGGIF